MAPEKCKTPGCEGFVPPDGPDYWQYCNDCGMEMGARKDKNNKICRRKGCNNPVDKPYYSFCQECFYSDVQHKKLSTDFDDRYLPLLGNDDVPF